MHLLGKILAFLVLVAAGVAAVFTSKLVTVRNSWTVKAAAYKSKYTKDLQPGIAKLESEVERYKNELLRSQDLWGKSWNNVQTNVAKDGGVNVGIGVESDIHQGLVLYGFEIGEDGKSTYRGSFVANEVGNGTSSLKPNWRVKPDEVQQWQSGNWRWRNSIPSGYQENFDKQLLTILRYEETLGDRQRTLATQKQLLEQANDTLKLREAELVGGDVLSKAPAVDSEFREGLVPAVEQTEEERNQKLEQIDELRRKVREVQADIERLNAENADLVQRLPASSRDAKISQKKN
jgi:hypothetical protein